jgi:hypothetical protein
MPPATQRLNRLRSSGHHHLADRIDHQVRLVEMNPMRAGRRNNLLHAVADAAYLFISERRRFSRCQNPHGNLLDRLRVVHLSDGVGHGLDVAAHPGVVAGPRPMGGNDGPDLARHLAHLVLDAVEDVLAAIAGGACQLLRRAAGAQEERSDSQAGKSDARRRNGETEELLAAVDLGLLAWVQRRPLFDSHWVHQHDAAHFLRVVERKAAHHQPAKGMSHQDVGRLDAGSFQ